MSFFKVGHSVGVAVAYWMAWTTGGGQGGPTNQGVVSLPLGCVFSLWWVGDEVICMSVW